MPIPRRHSLAGTNGIPAMDERVYIEVDLERTNLGRDEYGTRPARIHWPDGRSWEIEGVFSRQDFGREIFGNLRTRYTVGIRRQTKTTYHDSTGWFIRHKRRGESLAPKELISSPRRSDLEARSC